MIDSMKNKLTDFLDVLGLDEPPMGIFFTDKVEYATFLNLVCFRFNINSCKDNHELSIQNQDVKFHGNDCEFVVSLSGLDKKKCSI